MLHHERLKPPPDDYLPDEWNLIETALHPEFIEQTESVLALSNGYLGLRGCPEEGAPTVQNGTFINGFYETWPIVYGEEAYGFARTGQTILDVPDSKIIRLFIDDEPFILDGANIRNYDRRLNMQSGTLDRELVWETASGKQVRIRSRRLVSFSQRHVAAISYEVTLLNSAAPVIISSEIMRPGNNSTHGQPDPRLARRISSAVLQHRAGYARERRIILAYSTQQTKMIVVCGIDHSLATNCRHHYKASHTETFGQVAFSIEARPQEPIHLAKYMVYHSAVAETPEFICNRGDWTLDRITNLGLPALFDEQQQYLKGFWQRSDVQVKNIRAETSRLTTVEMQQAIRVNLFHIIQASARTDTNGVPAKGLTGRAYEGQYFWDIEIYLIPFLSYTSPEVAKNLLRFRYRTLGQARARARELHHCGALYPWRTISGEEASSYYAAGTAQYHINADIAYALRKYVNATGDEQFLCDCGAEMLVEPPVYGTIWAFSPRVRGESFASMR